MSHNVSYTLDPKTSKLTITVDMSKAAREKARTSATGKTKLLATTGAAVQIPDTDAKLAVNVMIPNV